VTRRAPPQALSPKAKEVLAVLRDHRKVTMAILRPKKLKRPRMGVRKPERRIFQVHQAFVRRHSCSVPGCQGLPIEFAHATSRGAGGHDRTGFSCCTEHHVEQHTIGIETFQRKYNIDLQAIAAEFARLTPDKALRQAIELYRRSGSTE